MSHDVLVSLCILWEQADQVYPDDTSVPQERTEDLRKVTWCSGILDSYSSLELLSPLILEQLQGPLWSQKDPEGTAVAKIHCIAYAVSDIYSYSAKKTNKKNKLDSILTCYDVWYQSRFKATVLRQFGSGGLTMAIKKVAQYQKAKYTHEHAHTNHKHIRKPQDIQNTVSENTFQDGTLT